MYPSRSVVQEPAETRKLKAPDPPTRKTGSVGFLVFELAREGSDGWTEDDDDWRENFVGVPGT